MGNRILKESIRISRQIEMLSYFEEVVFYRLITAADDYGIYSADPVMLARTLFPLRESVTGKMMTQAADHLEEAGLIRRYRVEGKGDWLQIVSWEKHQRLRNSRHVYPIPEEGTEEIREEASDETELLQETEKPVKNSEPAEVRELPVITLPLNDNSEYGVSQAETEEYAALYPAVDIVQELRKMRGWCNSNPTKRKTRNGIRKFINSWLAREQDRGGSPGRPDRTPLSDPFLAIALENTGEMDSSNSFTERNGGGIAQ